MNNRNVTTFAIVAGAVVALIVLTESSTQNGGNPIGSGIGSGVNNAGTGVGVGAGALGIGGGIAAVIWALGNFIFPGA